VVQAGALWRLGGCAPQKLEQTALGDERLTATIAEAGMFAQGPIVLGDMPGIEKLVEARFKLVATHGWTL
jgi:hypothetical protein